jgi:predicted RNA-binding Zn ribbon-like protein
MSGVAPGELETLRAFTNTYDPDEGQDHLADAAGLARWLAEHGFLQPGEEVAAADLWRARRLRSAFQRLAVANHDGVPDPMAAEQVGALAGECHLVVRLGPDGAPRLEPAAGGAGGALARLLAIFYTAAVDGTWPRLKVCGNDTCRWAFYDATKNRSGRFCCTACGNAVNARAYRRRKAAGSASSV